MRRRRSRGPVERNNDGTFTLNIEEHEHEILLSFVDQLSQLLRGDTRDLRMSRLFPVASSTDEEADREFQRYMHEELVESRLAMTAHVREVLQARRSLTAEDMTRFMLTLNGLRLVLGTILGVTDDESEPEFDEDDPVSAQWHLYMWLGWLLEWVIDAQTTG